MGRWERRIKESFSGRKNNSIKDAWDSDEFNKFRDHFLKACSNCKKRNICMGGCPIGPEIVLCHPTICN